MFNAGPVHLSGMARLRIVLCLGLVAVVLTVCLVECPNPYAVDQANHELVHAVWDFCRCFGRMPDSFSELVAAGYLRPVKLDNEILYQRFSSRDPSVPPTSAKAVSSSHRYIRDTSRIEFAWGITPDDLVLRNGRVYYRNEPAREALLARSKTPWTGKLARDRSLMLYKAILEGAARRSAQSAPTTRSAAPGQGKTLEDGGVSSLDGATQR